MIDLHCHPLPFLDDGAADWDVALAMARIAVAEGVTQWVATPHWSDTPGESEQVQTRLAELRERLAAAQLPLVVHPGHEVVLSPRLLAALREGAALPLAGSSYILLETAHLARGAYILNAVFQLQSSGYRIVLAHPERVRPWHDDLSKLRGLVARSCFLQVNAGSLVGDFGKEVRRAAERLLRLGWVQLLASDAHNADSRPPRLRPALARAAAIVGEAAAHRLVVAHPARVLANELLPEGDPDATLAKRRFWFAWPFRR